MKRQPPLLLILALVLYAVLALTTVRQVGTVGEVAIGWSLPASPDVLLSFESGQLADGYQAGPLRASQVRPIERLSAGPLNLPLAINSYTGGPPDWISRAAAALGGQSAALLVHLLMGAALIVLVHRFLRFHGSPGSGGVAALVLATDWSTIFYRKVLGGTEVLLLAAGLLLVWSSWSRRWAGGRHGGIAIAAAVGLGLLAKVTFLPTLVAWGIALLLTRHDKPSLKPPPAPPWGWMAAIVVGLTAPLWVSWIHHGLAVPSAGHIRSHDFLGLQLQRALSGLSGMLAGERSPARELPTSLLWFLGNPNAWLSQAYGGEPARSLAWLQLVGWGVAAVGSVLEWRRPQRNRAGALLRVLSIMVPVQLLLLWLSNRDLHHLAQATPNMALWFGLAATRILRLGVHPRSWRQTLLGFTLSLPLVVSGIWSLCQVDALVTQSRVPLFSEPGQQQLVQMLEQQGVSELVACDYDLYGMLEIRAPQIHTLHAWGAVSVSQDRSQAFAQLLELSQGRHLLLVRPSAPMLYNLSPTASRLKRAQERSGLELLLVQSLKDEHGEWAWLYQVPGAQPL